MFNGWNGEDTEVWGCKLRTPLKLVGANVLPPGDFVPSHCLPQCARLRRCMRNASAECSSSAHLAATLAAWEFVAADAPTTLASLVHFWGAALLIDLSTQWAAVQRRCASRGPFSLFSGCITPAGVSSPLAPARPALN